MNFFEFVAPMLLLLVVTVRYIHEQSHWFIYAAAYLAWLLQIVKFAPVFKFTGVYIDSLRIMILHDIMKFGLLILISIIIFSGTFLLVLKAENTLEKHQETKSFENIFLVGLRVMIESDSIIEYTGDDGYKFAGGMAMMVFMFFIIVVLLNMLIAQLINTFQKIESSSLKGFYVRKAKIVARLEREQLPFIFNNDDKRSTHYKESLKIEDGLSRVSDSGILYEDPIIQLQHMRRDVRSISKTLDSNSTAIATFEEQISNLNKEFQLRSKVVDVTMKDMFTKVCEDMLEVQNVLYGKTYKNDECTMLKQKNIKLETERNELIEQLNKAKTYLADLNSQLTDLRLKNAQLQRGKTQYQLQFQNLEIETERNEMTDRKSSDCTIS